MNLKPIIESQHVAGPGKQVVVVGTDGRLGSSLAAHLEARHRVTRVGRSAMDLGSSRSISERLLSIDYDHMIITGALTGVDYCENHTSEAFAINSIAPAKIAEISAIKGAHVTYISTDLVFDGSKQDPYVETDEARPISVYGASKLEGETRVMAAAQGNLVLRISWVFGPGRPAFPEWIIERSFTERSLALPGDKVCCPTYTIDLVRWIESLTLDPPDRPASGVYHLCNSAPCTWRDWGQACIDAAREAGLPVKAQSIAGVPVASIAAFTAKRPVNSAMSTEKFSRYTQTHPRDWTEALREFVLQSVSLNGYAQPRTPCKQ